MPSQRLVLASLALAAMLAAGCGKKDNPTQPPGGGGGGTVAEPFDSGNFSSASPVKVFVHTFTAAGTYRYHCSLHGTQTSGMNGDVTVLAGPGDSVAVVSITDNAFTPGNISVHEGNYVRWVANGSTHTVTRP